MGTDMAVKLAIEWFKCAKVPLEESVRHSALHGPLTPEQTEEALAQVRQWEQRYRERGY